jgi:hypothetical protein
MKRFIKAIARVNVGAKMLPMDRRAESPVTSDWSKQLTQIG